ncbi:MAG: M23 family metallopeptidase [Beutenbergiaceae bacterium]
MTSMSDPARAMTAAGLALAAVLALSATPQISPDELEAEPGPASGPVARVSYQEPVAGTVVSDFDAPSVPWASGHRGVDLAAAANAPVVAAADGVVAFAGTVAGRGVVSIDHADGIRTTYEPVLAAVSAGQSVAAGQVIGTVAAQGSHCDPNSCLHWGARVGQSYLDPLSLLGSVIIRLYPD